VRFGEEDTKLAKGNVLDATIFSTFKVRDNDQWRKICACSGVRESGRPYVTEGDSLGPDCWLGKI